MNQQDVSKIHPLPESPVNGLTNTNVNPSSTRSIFTLNRTTVSNQHIDPQQPNMNMMDQPPIQLPTTENVNTEREENIILEPVTKTNSISFTPKKFVPLEKSNRMEERSMYQASQLPTDDKIKAKWSPGPATNEEQPKYKKIQPIFQKTKSPHKIT